MSYPDACTHVGQQPQKPTSKLSTPRPSVNSSPVLPPAQTWAEQAQQFVYSCQDSLEGTKAQKWLNDRGLTDETIFISGIGYNSKDQYQKREKWGLQPERRKDGRPKGVWLPRGIVIPWLMDGEVVKTNIRRPIGDPSYIVIAGGTSTALFGADDIDINKPTVIVEGEIDCLTLQQEARHLVNVVATGSTQGARRTKWLARLSLCPSLLVSFDADQAGNEASAWWIKNLDRAKRWKPYWSDVNQLHQQGVSLVKWIEAAL